MRIRKNKNARPALLKSSIYIQNPAEHYGNWKNVFSKEAPISMELGCGKGLFVAKKIFMEPQNNFIAIDIKDEMLYWGLKNITLEAEKRGEKIPENVKIMSQDIERIDMMLSEKDEIERIYINFCNPWPKDRHKKKRLTHTRQLLKYREFLKDGGEIHFKTDDDGLFEESLGYFCEAGFDVVYKTYDLHSEKGEYSKGNIITEHEKMFSEKGIKIKMLVAKKRDI